MSSNLYGVHEAAIVGHINPATMRSYVHRGEVQLTIVGGRPFINHESLMLLLAVRNRERYIELLSLELETPHREEITHA